MKTKKIKLKNKIIEVEICDSIFRKFRGLMFRNKNQLKPLLFEFEKPTKQGIHSIFCKPFKAVWLNNGKVIDEKIVKHFSLYIKPKGKFTQLIEIPLDTLNR